MRLTSEKMGPWVAPDTALLGRLATHTHIPTADERNFVGRHGPNQTDVGNDGVRTNSIIGSESDTRAAAISNLRCDPLGQRQDRGWICIRLS